jgi:hypothetical protein
MTVAKRNEVYVGWRLARKRFDEVEADKLNFKDSRAWVAFGTYRGLKLVALAIICLAEVYREVHGGVREDG